MEDRRNRLIERTVTIKTRSWNISEIAGPRQPDEGRMATRTHARSVAVMEYQNWVAQDNIYCLIVLET